MTDFSTDLAALCIRLGLSCKCHTPWHYTISNKLLRIEVYPSKRGQITLCFGQICNKYDHSQALQFIQDAFSCAEKDFERAKAATNFSDATSDRTIYVPESVAKSPTELPWHD